MLRHLRRSLVWACSLAVGAGILEALWHYATGSSRLGGLRMVTTAIMLYLLIAVIWAAPIGLVIGFLQAGRGRREPPPGFYGALHLALGLVLVAGYAINVAFLGGFLDPLSLAVDAALVGIGCPLLMAALRRPFAALAAVAGPTWRRLGPLYWLAVAAGWGLPLLGPSPRSGAAPPTAAPPPGAPNVLFLLVDTLRADHLGCYGYERPTSPRIDALAAGGVLYENCISQAPHTKQSTASILTSLYPPTHKVERFTTALAPEAQTLPQILHEAGWRTALMSANSFLSPTYGYGRGVERFEGSLVNPAFQLLGAAVLNRLQYVLVQELHLWPGPWLLVRKLRDWAFLGGENPYQHGMTAAELAAEFLAWQESLADDRPWFAYLQFMEPHAPYDPAPEHRIFGNPEPGSELGVWFPADGSTTFLPFARGPAAAPGQREAILANYDACIHEVDAQIGAILDELERRGELADTLVVLTSDHGEEFYEHGGWGHGQSLHRELLHVPLILSGPGLPAGRRVPARVRSVDILPTVLALVGVAAPAAVSGEVLPTEPEAAARPAYSEVQWVGHWAVSWRDDEGSLIEAHFRGQKAIMLYAADDPAERRELAGERPELAERLGRRMHERRQAYAAQAMRTEQVEIDDETRGMLSGLGYAGAGEDAEEPQENR
ncbi:MAG: hypothetical protein D6702_10095 [Planctomycetota bacterium]|nr:MAG: hypothetical protein D6702_10095 [Planctomycetota bacterium]